MELNKIICGDSLTVLKTLPDEFVDCVVTSPPYNKNGFRGRKDCSRGNGRWQGSDISYGEYQDNMDEENYQEWQISILDELYRIIKPKGSIFYNHKIRRANHEASHPFKWIMKSKLHFYQQIIWDRSGGPDHNVNYLDPTTELIFWLVKNVPNVYKKQSKFLTEIWKINPAVGLSHPAPFPLALVKNCILLTTKEGDTVLDPFMGSGSSGLAAKEIRRNYLGIELNPEYIEMAERRIGNFLW